MVACPEINALIRFSLDFSSSSVEPRIDSICATTEMREQKISISSSEVGEYFIRRIVSVDKVIVERKSLFKSSRIM